MNYFGEDQYGFKKGCGTRDAITVLKVVIDRTKCITNTYIFAF